MIDCESEVVDRELSINPAPVNKSEEPLSPYPRGKSMQKTVRELEDL